MPDFYPESTDENEDESRGVSHFLTDLAKIINRYSYEYDMSYAEILGCLDIAKQLVLDEMSDLALKAFLEDEENKKEEQENEEPGIEYE